MASHFTVDDLPLGRWPTREIHLETQCAPEGLLTGVNPKGEFHEIARPASEALLTGVTTIGEIHLESQCASEGILKGVTLRGGHKIVPPRTPTCPRSPYEGG